MLCKDVSEEYEVWSMEQCSDPFPVVCGTCRIHDTLCNKVGFVREVLLKILLALSLMNSALNPVSVWCDFLKHTSSLSV